VGAPVRKYNAHVHLEVVVPIGYDYDTELLERQIRLVDQAHPWVSYYVGGDRAPSINWMSDITMKEAEWIDRVYSVEIRPHVQLTFEQAYAYERYGDQLALSLAQILPKDVLCVRSALEIARCFNASYRPRNL
jgi:hypothetical protein